MGEDISSQITVQSNVSIIGDAGAVVDCSNGNCFSACMLLLIIINLSILILFLFSNFFFSAQLQIAISQNSKL